MKHAEDCWCGACLRELSIVMLKASFRIGRRRQRPPVRAADLEAQVRMMGALIELRRTLRKVP